MMTMARADKAVLRLTLGLGLAVLVALSRVYLAKHFPSDVVAGAAIGLLAGWITCRFSIFSPVHGRT